MKKVYILILIMLFTFVPAFSETKDADASQQKNVIRETYKLNAKIEYNDNEIETIYLDENIEKPHVNIPKKTLTLPVNILNITSNSNASRSALARTMVNRNSSLTDILPFGGSVTERIGGFSYGQIWSQDISYGQMEDTTAFFLKYDFSKIFALTSSIRQAANQDIGTQYNTLRIIPELRITDKLTIKDSFSSYMNLPKNKNEIIIVYTPELSKYTDCLKFELGLAQSFYRNGKQSAALSFSTGFKL